MSLCNKIRFPFIAFRILKRQFTGRNLHNVFNKNVNITSTLVNLQPAISTLYIPSRLKSKKTRHDSDDEDEVFEDDDNSLSKDSKVVKFSTTSMRADGILKSGLSIARNKIEQIFYESKIRINGKKITKKSASVKVGDEVDIIKMVSPNNSNHLYVARVEILNVTPKEESITITARRFKNLLIENYEGEPYKSSSVQENEA